ncbi:MAG: hypothetical protein ACXVH7_10100 [Thermoanaerobaculia bacterium]
MLQIAVIVIAVAAIAVLGFNLWKRFAADDMARFNASRRGSCRLVGRGDLIDGSRHVPVALAIDNSTLFYENVDMSASVDLQFLKEVEYDNELSTGRSIPEGKVMRLRSVSQVFEFILDNATAPQWEAILPAVRLAR